MFISALRCVALATASRLESLVALVGGLCCAPLAGLRRSFRTSDLEAMAFPPLFHEAIAAQIVKRRRVLLRWAVNSTWICPWLPSASCVAPKMSAHASQAGGSDISGGRAELEPAPGAFESLCKAAFERQPLAWSHDMEFQTRRRSLIFPAVAVDAEAFT